MVNCCHINWPFWLVTFWCGLLQTLMEIWLEKMEIRHLWVQGLWSQNKLQEEDHENIPISYVTAVPFELWYWSTGNYSPMDFDVLCSNSTHRQTAENNLIFKISITDSWIIPNPKENTHVAAFNGICPFHPSVLFCFPYCFLLCPATSRETSCFAEAKHPDGGDWRQNDAKAVTWQLHQDRSITIWPKIVRETKSHNFEFNHHLATIQVTRVYPKYKPISSGSSALIDDPQEHTLSTSSTAQGGGGSFKNRTL